MVNKFSSQQLTMPGFTPKSMTPPSSILEAPPPKPQLNVLVWMNTEKAAGRPKGVKVPESLLLKWYNHPTHGPKFKELVDQILAECGNEDRCLL